MKRAKSVRFSLVYNPWDFIQRTNIRIILDMNYNNVIPEGEEWDKGADNLNK